MLIGTISDLHIPYQNQRKVNLVLDIFKDIGINILVLNGDIADFYTINAHGPKHPQIRDTIDKELIALEEFMSYIRKKFPGVKIVFNSGNHEHRLDRYIIANCPAFYNHLTLEKLIDFKHYDIELHEYNSLYELPCGLGWQHSPPSYSENHASTSLKKTIDVNRIYGCSHRPGWAIKKGGSGKYYYTHMLGWFGDIGHVKNMISEYPDNKKVYQFVRNYDFWGCSFTISGATETSHQTNQYVIDKNQKGNYFCLVGNNLYEG